MDDKIIRSGMAAPVGLFGSIMAVSAVSHSSIVVKEWCYQP
ncbi:MAG: hypothetical protein AB1599_02600 [Planctomycetota bacterium]